MLYKLFFIILIKIKKKIDKNKKISKKIFFILKNMYRQNIGNFWQNWPIPIFLKSLYRGRYRLSTYRHIPNSRVCTLSNLFAVFTKALNCFL